MRGRSLIVSNARVSTRVGRFLDSLYSRFSHSRGIISRYTPRAVEVKRKSTGALRATASFGRYSYVARNHGFKSAGNSLLTCRRKLKNFHPDTPNGSSVRIGNSKGTRLCVCVWMRDIRSENSSRREIFNAGRRFPLFLSFSHRPPDASRKFEILARERIADRERAKIRRGSAAAESRG